MERFRATGVYAPATYAQIVLAGSTLYIAAQLSVDAEGEPVEGDCEQQANQIWQQIGSLLGAAQATYVETSSASSRT